MYVGYVYDLKRAWEQKYYINKERTKVQQEEEEKKKGRGPGHWTDRVRERERERMMQYFGKTKTGALKIPFRNCFCEDLYEMEQRDKNSWGAVVSQVEGATGLVWEASLFLSLFSLGGLRSEVSVQCLFVFCEFYSDYIAAVPTRVVYLFFATASSTWVRWDAETG